MKFLTQKLKLSTGKQRSLLIGLLSLLCLGLIFTPLSNPIKRLVQQDRLIQQNESYLSGIIETDRKVFVKLAEIDALLAVLRSGEVGISFIVDLKVQVGGTLSTLSTVVEDSLAATITSITATSALKVFLELSEYLSRIILGLLLLAISLLCFQHVLGYKNAHKMALETEFIEMLALLFLSLYILLPYSIHGASYIENTIFSVTASEKNHKLDSLHTLLIKDDKKVGFKNKAKSDFKKFERIAVDVTHKIENMMAYHVEHFLHTLFRIFVIPVGVFGVLFLWFKKVLLPKFKTWMLPMLQEGEEVWAESVMPTVQEVDAELRSTTETAAVASKNRRNRVHSRQQS